MSEVATELAVQQAIARQLDELIRAGSRNVKLLEGSEMKESQIRNALNVAATSQSIEEVTNFIRYQIGRDTRKLTWARKAGGQSFGTAVIADIETGQVQRALEAVIREVPNADPVAVRSKLIALYLGYLNRCFIYADKTKDWQSLSVGRGSREETQANV
jgi:hypothetical protein